MPPAASDDFFRQQNRASGDQSPYPQDFIQPSQENNDSGGKTKKKGKKGKDKAAKALSKSPPEDLRLAASPPLQAESSPYSGHPLVPTSNQILSPVLNALESLTDTTDHDLAIRTDTWAKSIPFGKSPPNDIVPGELPGGSPLSFPTPSDKGGFSQPSSSSPPPRRRPLSYGNGYLSSNLASGQSADRQKTHSLSAPYDNQIPLPHLPQPHFYGAPDIDIPLFPGSNRAPGEESYSFCGFDTISGPLFKSSRMGATVLLVGSDGVLEVLAIEDRKSRLVGELSGLKGRVIDAKIVNCISADDPYTGSRPHIAVIIHGPCAPSEEEGRTSSTASETNEVPPSHAGRRSSIGRRPNEAKLFQTRTEVYSLRSGEQVATLFATRPAPCFENIPGLPAVAPSPSGNLKLYVSGSHIVLASGISGEVFIYGLNHFSPSCGYQCMGKTWTSIQTREARRYSTSSSSTDPDASRNDSPNGSANSDTPILALKGRWLAIVPPSSTYRPSIRGTVPASLIQGKVFGLETRSPPGKPAVTSATDVGEGESLFDKVARGVTQELVRGARWMGDQGLQAWNNYWNKDQAQNMSNRRSPNLMDLPPQGYGIFPPTHAQETQLTSPSEPDIVSVLDLRKLEDGSETKSVMLNPLATFQVPNGCSFLSFSPNGLVLLTASKKGDVQYVWDLMQARYCRAGSFLAENSTVPSANVRQIARFARLTTSFIVDVIWFPPSGDRLAVVTRKGTVHVFDLPRSAFQWPPFRRAHPPPSKAQSSASPVGETTDKAGATNPLSAAFKLVGGKTQPILAAVRGRAPSATSAFPAVSAFAIPSAAGVRGGKVVAAGLSKSMGAATGTVNTLRHAGENRLHLSGLARDPAASRVVWISNKGQPFLGLVDNGFFRLYRIKRSLSAHKGRQWQSVVGSKEIEYKLPANLQTSCGPLPVGAFSQESNVSAVLTLPSSNLRPSTTSKVANQPLSQAEIETNAPYQPFHTDHRVNLFVHSNENELNDPLSSSSGQWIFGDSFSLSKLHVRPFSAGGGEDDSDVVHEQHDSFGDEMENLISLGNSTGNVGEVLITTRRKKKHSSAFSAAPDGFFEDDCEVLDFARDRV
ncbi:uncharacterized protein ACLA_031510 [Aspergillus clavatus NRRL 1]|uniref:Uncharacterized protein n=1 Tax=Aspergillus clavatus (strain ATCC 1007 / CBS 513.65 / DSM 816 / NCTC 3887 / NRRL 1 / QM 1276 / 107) TaxID=344612 RepID=A1CRZ7_ASPCL|nr:uncharacterized protein ACLA_031510 [Aspergillus clavatus NRRL 1]EAW08418.1 conserved hypothetical protein [Aspergillus clavatus NRRL 1]